jgi:hypothetical protein
MMFELVFDRFQTAPNSEVPGTSPSPRVRIFSPKYLGTYALLKDGFFGTFVFLIMFRDKNQVVAPPVTPKGRSGGRTQNLMIILKILRIRTLNSKINRRIRRITEELRIF